MRQIKIFVLCIFYSYWEFLRKTLRTPTFMFRYWNSEKLHQEQRWISNISFILNRGQFSMWLLCFYMQQALKLHWCLLCVHKQKHIEGCPGRAGQSLYSLWSASQRKRRPEWSQVCPVILSQIYKFLKSLHLPWTEWAKRGD